MNQRAQVIEQLAKRLNGIIMSAAEKATNKTNRIALDAIIKRRFLGKGPFPVSQHRLGVDSGRLKKSLTIFPAKVTGNVLSIVGGQEAGSTVKYFNVHEFGFDGEVQVKSHTRRIKRKRRRRKGEAKEAVVRAHSRHMKVPKRAPLTAGFEDKETATLYESAIVRAAERAVAAEFERLSRLPL
jgi:hypothetical protein